jgi:hypothetical protein
VPRYLVGEPLGRNDTYGYALAAQPDKSQGRPTTNAGSQPIEQERPAHTCSPKAPVPDGRTVRPVHLTRQDRTPRGPPPHFIPGTNAVESLNYQLRKVTKARGSFPNDAAALKLLYLAIRNINQKRGTTDGQGTYNWTQALNTFAIQFPDRLPL